ncbi:MAG: adenylosuccinate lyase [Bdellovibrionaceae bacterium]|nr:adenylosuccinate lyase [Pseudobdellovibrionaceae bacterium]
MIDRYSRPEMSVLWSVENKFSKMLQVEIAVAKAQSELGIIPHKAYKAIAKKSKFSVKRILEIEAVTKHDVIAFVSNVAENVGKDGKYIHYGMTSSDVLDTAFSLQIQEAGAVLLASTARLKKSLQVKIAKNEETLCAGRTHGMFAEPTSFGMKLMGFLAELIRNEKRVVVALEELRICKLSGAVGTYSSQEPIVEKKVSSYLGLKAEWVATQVVPRDRHANLLNQIALLGAGLERLAIELRHLQRSEVSEVVEGFSKGQKGSSAMPHKKNPISAENITGLSRLLRSYALSAMENIPLWHERDISHSSVERVIFPDSFIVVDYALNRMAVLIDGLEVNAKRMLDNMEQSQGQLYSSHVLLHLVKKGLSREVAYAHVQRLCHSLGFGEHLKYKINEDEVISSYFTKKDLDDIFSGKKHRDTISKVIKKQKKVLQHEDRK